MPGILGSKPRAAVIFAALTLLIAALAVFSPSQGLAKSAPEAAVSFDESGSPITLLPPEEVTIEENTLALITLYLVASSHEHIVTLSLTGEDADDFYLEEYRNEDGFYVGEVYNSRPFDFEDEDDKILKFTFNVTAKTSIASGGMHVDVTVIVTDQPELPPATEKPGRPQNLSVAVAVGSLTATWDPPADGGAASGYNVDYRPAGAGGKWIRVMPIGPATSSKITGLKPGSYLVRVQAVNEIGASRWARQRTAKPVRPPPAEAPGRPRNLSLTAGPGSVAVSWDPPASGGAASGYNVEYRFAGGGNEYVRVLSNANVTSTEITGLEPDYYVVRVRAVNEIGESKRTLKRVEVGP